MLGSVHPAVPRRRDERERERERERKEVKEGTSKEGTSDCSAYAVHWHRLCVGHNCTMMLMLAPALPVHTPFRTCESHTCADDSTAPRGGGHTLCFLLLILCGFSEGSGTKWLRTPNYCRHGVRGKVGRQVYWLSYPLFIYCFQFEMDE